MFPESLFPGWLFPGWAFPHLASVPIAPLPGHMAEAIADRFASTANLVALFAGGIFQDQAQTGSPYPYLLFTIRTSGSSFNSARSTWQDTTIRFRAVATSAEVATSGSLLVRDAFANASLDYQTGFTSRIVPRGEPETAVPAGRGREDKRLFRSTLEFRMMARVGRG